VIDPHTMHMLTAMMAILPIFILIGIVIILVPYWIDLEEGRLLAMLSLLMFVPLVGIVMLYVSRSWSGKSSPSPKPRPTSLPAFRQNTPRHTAAACSRTVVPVPSPARGFRNVSA